MSHHHASFTSAANLRKRESLALVSGTNLKIKESSMKNPRRQNNVELEELRMKTAIKDFLSPKIDQKETALKGKPVYTKA